MKNTIKCKNCGAEIEVSEALTHQIEEQLTEVMASKHKKELEEVRAEATKTAVKRSEEENEELREKNRKMLQEMAEIEKTKREMKETMERMDLENQKKLNAEMEKIRDQSLKIAQEKSQEELMQLKKQLEDTRVALDSANYKLSQKSQQLQGEVLELDLEKSLEETFPDDEITPVGKGVQGADIVQHVKGKSGREAGIILWETKDAKWTPTWLPKLREDGRSQGATALVLITKNLPKEIESFAVTEGVVVAAPIYALSVAGILRRSLLQIAMAKLTAEQSSEKLQELYEYLQSESFRHRFESFAEGIRGLHEDLETEKRSMERVWKRREIQIKRVSLNISRMYGELQGVMGNSLPEIRVLSLPETTAKEDDET
jgi:hypothetical protein